MATEEAIAKNQEIFYSAAKQYWSEIPATLDGMLGGFGFISHSDIQGSKMLLKQLFHSKHPPGRGYALDCGAGIGRVSKFLLTDIFENVDMVEQNSEFLERAKSYLGDKRLEKVSEFFSIGLQDFKPEKGKYDVIWIQWVLGHLTDDDFLKFLKSCQEGLKRDGVIIIKENVTSSGEVEVDTKDSSVTRPMKKFREIFKSSGLDLLRLMKQNNFPKGIYTVYMFALRPRPSEKCETDVNAELKNLHLHDTQVAAKLS